jgi:hypothetical protein
MVDAARNACTPVITAATMHRIWRAMVVAASAPGATNLDEGVTNLAPPGASRAIPFFGREGTPTPPSKVKSAGISRLADAILSPLVTAMIRIACDPRHEVKAGSQDDRPSASF